MTYFSSSASDEEDRASGIASGRSRLEEGTQTDYDSNYASADYSSSSLEYDSDDLRSRLGPSSSDQSDSTLIDRFSRLFTMTAFSGALTSSSSSATSNTANRWTQTNKDPLESETERLAFDIVFYTLGRRKDSPKDEITVALRRNVSLMLEKHAFFFSGLMTRLRIQPGADLRTGFVEIAAELFAHNDVTWGKIIALFAFGARLARYCSDKHMDAMVYDVITNLAEFAVFRLTPFLKEKGGWSSVLEAFPVEEDYEGKIWRSLLVTGLGLGAVATFLAMQN